jgi:hypothetical protein
MRSARTAVAGVLFCLVLPACGTFNKHKETTDTPKRVPPHLQTESGTPGTSSAPKQLDGGSYVPPPVAGTPTGVVLKGEDAVREMQSRQLRGGAVNNLNWENGKMTVNSKFDDGSIMSIVSDDNGNHLEYRPVR